MISAEASTRQHPFYIKEILGWACGRNISQRKQAADFVVIGLFQDRDALSTFLTHKNHQNGVLKWQRIAGWQVVDLEIGSDTTKFFGLLNCWNDSSFAPLEYLKVS